MKHPLLARHLGAWLYLGCAAAAGAADAPEYYRHGNDEMLLLRAAPDRLFLTLTRREGAHPAEILAAGAELHQEGAIAKTAEDAPAAWQLTLAEGHVELAGSEPAAGTYEPFAPPDRLSAARGLCDSADAELNRAYGAVRAKLTPARAAALRDDQRDWIHFTYGEAPPADAAPEAWLARRDRAAERILFLERLSHEADAGDRQSLPGQLKAAEEAEAWPAVAELARRLLASHPKDPALWEKRARALASAQDWTQCDAVLKEWSQAVPKVPAIFDSLRGDVAEGRDDSTAAILSWTVYAKAAPKDAEVRDKIAAALEKRGDWAGAAPVLEERLKIEPDAAVWARLSLVHARLHDWRRMSADIRRGNSLDATDPEVKNQLPRIERLERDVPALEKLDRAIDTAGSGPGPLLERAHLYLREEWPDAALLDVERALKLNAGSRLGAIEKAFALVALEREEEALALQVDVSSKGLENLDALRRLSKADDEVAKTPGAASLASRAAALGEVGQNLLAEADARAALKLDPANLAALEAQALALAKLKRAWEAIPKLQHAADLEPRNPLLWLGLGEAQAEVHRAPEAIAALDHALQLDPQNSRARKLREETMSDLPPQDRHP